MRSRSPVLLVSWTVPPVVSGSSVTVRELHRKLGADDAVLVGGHPRPGSSERVDDVYHVGPPSALAWTHRYVRWISWSLLPSTVRELVRLGRERECGAVVAVFPNEYFTCAAWLAAKCLELPFFPWFHNTYLDNRTGVRRWLARWLEPRIMRSAERVLVLSDGLREHFTGIYPDVSFEVIRHGFEPPAVESSSPPGRAGEKIRLAHVGGLNASCADAARRFAEAFAGDPRYELHLYGVSEAIARRFGFVGSNVIVEGVLPHSELHEELLASDVCLLPHGFEGRRSEVEFRTIFPTRTIPYLFSGRPILAHSPPDTFLTSFLNEHECALVVDRPDPQEIRDAAARLSSDRELSFRLTRNAARVAENFQVEKTAARFRSVVSGAHGK